MITAPSAPPTSTERLTAVLLIIGSLQGRVLSPSEEQRFLRAWDRLRASPSCPGLADEIDAIRGHQFKSYQRLHSLAAALRRHIVSLTWKRVLPEILFRRDRIHSLILTLPENELRAVKEVFSQRYGSSAGPMLQRWARRKRDLELLRRLEQSDTFEGARPAESDCDVVYATAADIAPPLRDALERSDAEQLCQLYWRIPDSLRMEAAKVLTGAETSLQESLTAFFPSLEAEILAELWTTGTVPYGKILYQAVAGIGTDEPTVRDLLRMTPVDRMDELQQCFAATWSTYAPWYERLAPRLFSDIERRTFLECGGDCWFDLSCYFSGRPDTLSARTALVLDRYAHERSGRLIPAFDKHFPDHSIIAAMHDAVRRYDEKRSTGEDGYAYTCRYSALCDALEQELEIFRELKHQIGNGFASIAVPPVATSALLALVALKAPLWYVMGGVAAVSGSGRLVTKLLVKGKGYHRDEVAADLLLSGIDGLTLFANRVIRHVAVRNGIRFATKLAIRTGLGRSFRSGCFRPLIYRDEPRQPMTHAAAAAAGKTTEELLRELEAIAEPPPLPEAPCAVDRAASERAYSPGRRSSSSGSPPSRTGGSGTT